MDIADLLSSGGIVLRGGVSSKRQALHTVAEAASIALGIDEGRALDALLEREALGSTGLGSGVAVPHARVPGLDRVCAVFVRLDTPVAYE
ncbi:PTS sugar transporter subunit IIA, partial [Leptospira borgpetersenii serovar Ballum]|nr:PTS sugar transporter subunit IIA [Leptospira borgpetersenii serovar Ballum]